MNSMNQTNNSLLETNSTRVKKGVETRDQEDIYNIPSFLMNNENKQKNMVDKSNTVGVYPKSGNIDTFTVNVESGLKLRKEKVDNCGKNGKRLLQQRTPGTGPYKAAGHTNNEFIDVESRIRGGLNARANGRACGNYADVFIDTFTPLVPCLKDEVQNVEHIIPVYWVRGGASTRGAVRNIDYLRMCGYKQ
jgi:hypothetical protein